VVSTHYVDKDSDFFPEKLFSWIMLLIAIPIGMVFLFVFGERGDKNEDNGKCRNGFKKGSKR
jgi:hypothetical protein